jgi:hypothetical protein
MRNIYKILVGKPEEKRPLGRPRLMWENNIRMYLKYIDSKDVDWIHLLRIGTFQWRALASVVMNLRFPKR